MVMAVIDQSVWMAASVSAMSTHRLVDAHGLRKVDPMENLGQLERVRVPWRQARQEATYVFILGGCGGGGGGGLSDSIGVGRCHLHMMYTRPRTPAKRILRLTASSHSDVTRTSPCAASGTTCCCLIRCVRRIRTPGDSVNKYLAREVLRIGVGLLTDRLFGDATLQLTAARRACLLD